MVLGRVEFDGTFAVQVQRRFVIESVGRRIVSHVVYKLLGCGYRLCRCE